MDHAGVAWKKKTRKIQKLCKHCAQVLLQSMPCPSSKLNTTKPPKDTQWERKWDTCPANRYGLKATRSRRLRVPVRAGACSGNTLQNTWSPLDLTLPEGQLGYGHLRRTRSQQPLRETRWEKGRQDRQHTAAHRRSADCSCRAAGTQLDPSGGTEQLPHSDYSKFPAKTAWICQDFSDEGLETTASTSHGNEAFRPF